MDSGTPILFEWDENKSLENIRKHGIAFEDVTSIFDDEYRVELFDSYHSTQAELRYIVIGFVSDILYVVYTERVNRIRIISARIATAEERKLYYDCAKIIREEN